MALLVTLRARVIALLIMIGLLPSSNQSACQSTNQARSRIIRVT